MRTLRVKDTDDNGILALDLKDILSHCGSKYKNREWYAYAVECAYSSWEDRFDQAPNKCLSMSYEELLDYANNVHQTIDGAFFVIKKGMKLNSSDISYDRIKEISDFIVEIIDSGAVEITTTDEDCFNRLLERYTKVSFMEE